MAIEVFQNNEPKIDASAFIAASADLIGKVEIKENASVWHHATLRGDLNEIVIGANSNIQDNCVVHLSDDLGTYVGEYVTVGHSAILHACTLEDGVLVGMGACVMDGAVIGARSIIGAKALVTQGMIVPPDSLVLGSPARVIRTLSAEEQVSGRLLAEKYVKNGQLYRERQSGGLAS